MRFFERVKPRTREDQLRVDVEEEHARASLASTILNAT
jgi:hypothetical protein